MEILKAFTQTYQTNKYIRLSSFSLCDTLISFFKDRIYKCRASDPVPNIGLLSRPETGFTTSQMVATFVHKYRKTEMQMSISPNIYLYLLLPITKHHTYICIFPNCLSSDRNSHCPLHLDPACSTIVELVGSDSLG